MTFDPYCGNAIATEKATHSSDQGRVRLPEGYYPWQQSQVPESTHFQLTQVTDPNCYPSDSCSEPVHLQSEQLRAIHPELHSQSASPRLELPFRRTNCGKQLDPQAQKSPQQLKISRTGAEMYCQRRFRALKLTYKGPIIMHNKALRIWLNEQQSKSLLSYPASGYQSAELVLAEIRALEYMPTTCDLGTKELRDLENTAVVAIKNHLTMLDDANDIAGDLIERTGVQRYLQAVLLNGKYCAVKLAEKPVVKGVFYCQPETSGVLVDLAKNPHLNSQLKGTHWHDVDLFRSDFESVFNYVVEIPENL